MAFVAILGQGAFVDFASGIVHLLVIAMANVTYPTKTEIDGFKSVDDVYKRSDIAGDFRTSLDGYLGNPTTARDVSNVTLASWDAAMDKFKITTSGAEAPLNLVQQARVRSFYFAMVAWAHGSVPTSTALALLPASGPGSDPSARTGGSGPPT